MATEKVELFGDYDQQNIYDNAQQDTLDPNARNFVVEFGRNKARIGSNLDHVDFELLFEEKDANRAERPVRWM